MPSVLKLSKPRKTVMFPPPHSTVGRFVGNLYGPLLQVASYVAENQPDGSELGKNHPVT